VDDKDQDIVRPTERETQANLQAVLQLCAAGKLRCSEKTRRPSAATVGTVVSHLAARDFYRLEPIAGFAWPLRDDFRSNCGADELDSLSRYDGLRAIRLNALGSHVLGLTKSYRTSADSDAKRVFKVLPNLDVVATGSLPSQRQAPPRRLFSSHRTTSGPRPQPTCSPRSTTGGRSRSSPDSWKAGRRTSCPAPSKSCSAMFRSAPGPRPRDPAGPGNRFRKALLKLRYVLPVEW
jgi:hypothetical protein